MTKFRVCVGRQTWAFQILSGDLPENWDVLFLNHAEPQRELLFDTRYP